MSYPVIVEQITGPDFEWSYGSGVCTFTVGHNRVEFDPFPGYGHNRQLAAETAGHLVEVWPPGSPVTYWLPELEHTTRTNAFAHRAFNYTAEGRPDTWHAHVMLSGKRTPIHPAMTRFLTAHEYGHHVEYWLEAMRGLDPGDVRTDYAAMRGLDVIDASGGHWHHAAAEVFADDFRTVIAGVELEHWPHPGVDRPGPEILDWWASARTDWLDHLHPLETT